MDQLKENAFALSLAGVGIVLLAAFYVLVYGPMQEVGRVSDETARTLRSARSYSGEEELPNSERVGYVEEQQRREKASLENAVAFYDQRAQRFGLFFGNVAEPPAPSTFWSLYLDDRDELLERYRSEFGIVSTEQAPVPRLAGILQDASQALPETVPLHMKKFWMLEAIVDTCIQLGLGGLEEVSFENARSRRSSAFSSSSGRKKDEKEPPFIVERIEVTVKIDLRFSQIQELLGALYGHPRVPFLDADVNYTKTPESLEANQSLRVTVTEDPRDDTQTPKSYAELVPEPTVEATLTLRALDWGGARPEETPEES